MKTCARGECRRRTDCSFVRRATDVGGAPLLSDVRECATRASLHELLSSIGFVHIGE